jgi:hypothetical protein
VLGLIIQKASGMNYYETMYTSWDDGSYDYWTASQNDTYYSYGEYVSWWGDTYYFEFEAVDYEDFVTGFYEYDLDYYYNGDYYFQYEIYNFYDPYSGGYENYFYYEVDYFDGTEYWYYYDQYYDQRT